MAKYVIFPKTEIIKVLKLIEQEYKYVYAAIPSPKNIRLMHLYSSMAVISFSGWLEDEMDNMVNLSLLGLNINSQKRLIGKRDGVYGASYYHFTQRLEIAFGSHGLEFIESQVGSTDKAILESILSTLQKLRNDTSHSHAITIPRNPTHILTDAIKIYPILKKFEKGARLYKAKHF